jgi:serine/threonine protein kinase
MEFTFAHKIIAQMLTRDYKKRPSARQLLKNKVFSSRWRRTESVTDSIPVTLENLSGYKSSVLMKKAVTSFIASNLVS